MSAGTRAAGALSLAELTGVSTWVRRSTGQCVGCCVEQHIAARAGASGRWRWSAMSGYVMDLRPVAPPAGRCVRCGGATWQHQVSDICGDCGRMTRHEAPEVRLRAGAAW